MMIGMVMTMAAAAIDPVGSSNCEAPVKFAMAAMGLCEEVYRLPMVSPRPASQDKIRAFLKELEILKEVHS